MKILTSKIRPGSVANAIANALETSYGGFNENKLYQLPKDKYFRYRDWETDRKSVV